jgi:hypothetical protein
MLLSYLVQSSTLKMEAMCFSEELVDICRAKWCYLRADINLSSVSQETEREKFL